MLELVDLDGPRGRAGGRCSSTSTAAGVNYADTHATEDTYLRPQTLPFVPGAEVGRAGSRDGDAGRRAARRGRRLRRAGLAHPGPSSSRCPTTSPTPTALALVLQGTTAWHLLRTSRPARRRARRVVVHAAAGGVGTLAVQLARQWGAGRVIATASPTEKRELALSLGADVAVDARRRRRRRGPRPAARGQRGPRASTSCSR